MGCRWKEKSKTKGEVKMAVRFKDADRGNLPIGYHYRIATIDKIDYWEEKGYEIADRIKENPTLRLMRKKIESEKPIEKPKPKKEKAVKGKKSRIRGSKNDRK